MDTPCEYAFVVVVVTGDDEEAAFVEVSGEEVAAVV